MTEATAKQNYKLSSEQKSEIHRRYYNRLISGESVQAIADDFGIYRKWVRVVALAMQLRIEKPPTSDQVIGG